jgi:hypothetical protein
VGRGDVIAIRPLLFALATSACHSTPEPLIDLPPDTGEFPMRASPVLYAQNPKDPCETSGLRYAPGEKVQRTVYGDGVDYTLTDRALYTRRVIIPQGSIRRRDRVAQSECIKVDMRPILQRGLIDWEVDTTTNYFLTADQSLITMPQGKGPEAAVRYALPFETRGLSPDRFFYYAKMIFIAPLKGGITVKSFAPNADTAFIPFDVQDPDAGFFLRRNRLYFGMATGVQTELVVAGATPTTVSAVDVE